MARATKDSTAYRSLNDGCMSDADFSADKRESATGAVERPQPIMSFTMSTRWATAMRGAVHPAHHRQYLTTGGIDRYLP